MTLRHDRVELLERYMRIPTVSRDMTLALLDQVRDFWQSLGLSLTPLVPDAGEEVTDHLTPALYGEIPGPAGAPDLLLYGHCDVQPTGELSRWRWEGVACDPFVPTYFLDGRPVDLRSVDDARLGDLVVVGRGGADNKGQHLANILGALDAARAGRLAWNVKIILDAEEERGSPNLGAIVRSHRDRLAARVLVASDGPKQKNAPTLVMGVRGNLGVELTVANGQVGAVHSGNYGNIVPNPVLPLARLIADVDERMQAYASTHDTFRREATEAFAKWQDRTVWTPFLRPTVNVNHFATDGTSMAQRRTVIPHVAQARVDVRLTPDTPLAAAAAIVRETFEAHRDRTPGLTFTMKTLGQPASYTSPARPEFGWVLRVLDELGDADPIALPTLGGTLPAWVFTELLEIPSFWIPSANADNRQHDANEHYVLKHFFKQIQVYERIASTHPM